MPFPPILADFGHDTLKATGTRPLAIVLVDWAEHPPIEATHSNEYYERLGFGDPARPFSTSNPINPASMTAYVRENSYGRFTFDRVAVFGPLKMGILGPDPGAFQRVTTILQKLVEVAPVAIARTASAASHTIGAHELSILLVENIPNAWPANSPHAPVRFTVGGVPITLTAPVAGGWQKTPFYQLMHELSHIALDTVDLYRKDPAGQVDNDNDNVDLTLMSQYSFDADDQHVVHLDVWHKMLLGWAEPRLFKLDQRQSAEIWEGADGAILLWDDAHRTNEYFLIERRRPDAPHERFDADVAGTGAVIWRIKQPVSDSVKALGAPNLKAGSNAVWRVGAQTPFL